VTPACLAGFRDALYLGDCDEGALDLCEALGWGEELQELVALGHKQVGVSGGGEAAAGVTHVTIGGNTAPEWPTLVSFAMWVQVEEIIKRERAALQTGRQQAG
jgi:hypothetical protein